MEILRAYKTKLTELLYVDPVPILQLAQSKKIITDREYNKMKCISDSEKQVIELLDKIMGKSSNVCQDFLKILKDVQDTYPQLVELFSEIEEIPSAPPSLSIEARPETLDEEHGVYQMRSRPRGYCVIINNKDFGKARLNFKTQKDRKGTDFDAEYLTKVFKWLHFEVVQYNDQTAEEIHSTMERYRKQDHSSRDCFVCCILSHGSKGAIEGTDGCSVPIREITSYFTGLKCPTLIKKPKVFFIQACQGTKTQKSVRVQADWEGHETEAELEPEDADPNTIPNDSDFLLGMATLEDYVSFRNVFKGSFYIQALCKNLELLCPRNYDILSILTTVNREVSEENMMRAKQMPEPRYTLTKKLLFPTS
ncbi:caspase-8-like [Acipenser oxyrinchus oxyrinchus]|uniref:Caspase-8 n=1 Tax=Acipenser oxyrinchus oxyrinchus TaxID=40147 RepID=A0AAD8DB95_ACIOX|nr:caspase-8-like [Acipenser oxyrinchus oxyrinchus]